MSPELMARELRDVGEGVETQRKRTWRIRIRKGFTDALIQMDMSGTQHSEHRAGYS